MWTWVIIIYLAMSLATFGLYAWDKHAAVHGGARLREQLLLLAALFGGWPGAWLARVSLRHKTQKQPFVFYFYLMVFLNCIGLVWLWVAQEAGRHAGLQF